MKTFFIIMSHVGWIWAATPLPAQTAPPAIPPKLAELLDAKDDAGQPVIAPEQRTYFDGLNDHLKELLGRAVETEFITAPDHLELLLQFELRPQKMELVLQDNCVLCHTDVETQPAYALFSLSPGEHESGAHMHLKHLLEDVHFKRGLSCAGCHGGDPTADFDHDFVEEWPSSRTAEDRTWLVGFCGRCHSDPTFMNRFNPSLATDQVAKFNESPHGQVLLQAKDQRAPQCVSCHGVHGIRPAKDPFSKVHPKQVSTTCGACHSDSTLMAGFTLADGSPLPTDQQEKYLTSVHGRALFEGGDLGAPTCNDCHGNHAAMPVGLSDVSQSCSLCHVANASLFDGSKHKQAFEQHDWPQCGKCHGNHAILKTSDAMLGEGPQSLCVDCHEQYSKENPDCSATAIYFHTTITKLDRAWNEHHALVEEFAMKGLDVEPITEQLSELADDLKKARAQIHAFNRNSFEQITAPGDKAVENLAVLAEKARSEFRFRQVSLLVSILLTGLVMIAIYLKLRRMEKLAR